MIQEAIVHRSHRLAGSENEYVGMVTILSHQSGDESNESEFLGLTNKLKHIIGKSEERLKTGFNSVQANIKNEMKALKTENENNLSRVQNEMQKNFDFLFEKLSDKNVVKLEGGEEQNQS